MKKHIVYATDHNFIMLCAVSIMSLLQTNDNCTIHLLVDDTLTEEDYQVFGQIWDKYSQTEHEYIRMDEAKFATAPMGKSSLTRSTYYRLLLPSVLQEVDICLYVDADTLIVGDLGELFFQDMDCDYIAGVWDVGIPVLGYSLEEIPDMDSYVNAGVLLMNLKKMREDGIEDKCFAILPNNYRFHDQDILNIICYGHIKLIDDKYNYFSHRLIGTAMPIVWHLIGWGGCRPSQNKRAKLAKTWWSFADMLKEFECYKKISREADEWYKSGSIRHLLDYCKHYNGIYVWGSKEAARRMAHALKYNGKMVLALVDNDSSRWGLNIEVPVISPNDMEIDDNTLVINTAWGARDVIRKQLKELGVSDKQIFDYRRRPAGFYTVLADEYRQEELEELFLWEYGTVRVE